MNAVITGIGALCALGDNAKTMWAAIERGEDGFATISRFDVAPYNVKIGALAPFDEDIEDDDTRILAYGYKAADEALRHAGIVDRSRVALVLGTSNGLEGKDIHTWSIGIARRLKIGGPIITLATACTSSTHALGFAADLVRHGELDCILAGGVDTLCEDIFAGFHSLGILSKEPCAPFSTNIGATLGEGAAFMVLETRQSAQARDITQLAVLAGYGLSADAFHDTRPEPSGRGMARAITSALSNAHIEPADIDYYNAHGTGTYANDASEWRAIERVFGDCAGHLPISSSKSFIGHAQGAAGALEAVITLMAMEHQVVPPTLHLNERRPHAPADPVASQIPRSHVVQNAISANAAFGGSNAALVFMRSKSETQFKRIAPRLIRLSSVSVVHDWKKLSQSVPHSELRTLDISARLLASAVTSSLLDGGLRLRSAASDAIGLFVGQTRVSPESAETFGKSIRERGLKHLSATAFTKMVVNAATGSCCRLFGLKGPTATLSTGAGSGLVAMILAANHLAWRDDTNSLLAAAVDEPDEFDTFSGAAACLLLGTKNDTAPVKLTAWALGTNRDVATTRVLAKTRYKNEDVSHVTVSGPPASASLQAVAEVYNAISVGKTGPFLICDSGEGTAGAAVILEAGN